MKKKKPTEEEIKLQEFIQEEIDFLSKNHNKVSNIPDPSIGDLIHIPRLFSIYLDSVDPVMCGSVKDCMYQDIPTEKHNTLVGYASANRAINSNVSYAFRFLVIEAIEVMKRKKGWGPHEYHYGDFIKIKRVKQLESSAGYKIYFESDAIPVITKFDKVEPGAKLFGIAEYWAVYDKNGQFVERGGNK